MMSINDLTRVAFWFTVAAVLVLSISPVLDPVPGTGLDKVKHVLAFFCLATLGSLGWPGNHRARVLGLLLLGAAIELLQGAQLIGRHTTWLDWLSDLVGVLLGVGTIHAGRRALRRLAKETVRRGTRSF